MSDMYEKVSRPERRPRRGRGIALGNSLAAAVRRQRLCHLPGDECLVSHRLAETTSSRGGGLGAGLRRGNLPSSMDLEGEKRPAKGSWPFRPIGNRGRGTVCAGIWFGQHQPAGAVDCGRCHWKRTMGVVGKRLKLSPGGRASSRSGTAGSTAGERDELPEGAGPTSSGR